MPNSFKDMDDFLNHKSYSVSEVSEKLKTSTNTVYVWLRSGALRGYRVNKFWRVREEDLLEFVNSTFLTK